MAAHSNGQAMIFCSCCFYLLLSFFCSSPILSGRVLDVTILPRVMWPKCANLECRSEMCCTRLAENTRRKITQKNPHLRTIAQLCRAMSSQLRHISTIGKELVKQQYLLHMSAQYGELRPTNG